MQGGPGLLHSGLATTTSRALRHTFAMHLRLDIYVAADRYWRLVDALANELVNVGIMTGHEARKVLREAELSRPR